ncbi:hypothetical protein PR048_000545 [Dryococelus australis]|uniref:Uncharacterized protein n=1 Tax=Dryococelus australis TaxID=614101 RepID=A0ABQ9IEY1_9NEOP|nr:hypothetical protein PR048_000545 [Dryococelus australis]
MEQQRNARPGITPPSKPASLRQRPPCLLYAKIQMTRPGNELCSPWRDASSSTSTPPRATAPGERKGREREREKREERREERGEKREEREREKETEASRVQRGGHHVESGLAERQVELLSPMRRSARGKGARAGGVVQPDFSWRRSRLLVRNECPQRNGELLPPTESYEIRELGKGAISWKQWGRGCVVVRLLAFHPGEPGSIPDGIAPPVFALWESCQTMPLVGGFARGSPVSPAFPFRRCYLLTSLRPHDIDFENRQYLSLHSWGKQHHDENTARFARRSDEELGVHVSVASIAPSLLDLGRAEDGVFVYGYRDENGRGAVAEYLRRWIGRGGPVPWSARSPDLYPVGLFLLGLPEEQVLQRTTIQSLQTITDATNRLRNELAGMQWQHAMVGYNVSQPVYGQLVRILNRSSQQSEDVTNSTSIIHRRNSGTVVSDNHTELEIPVAYALFVCDGGKKNEQSHSDDSSVPQTGNIIKMKTYETAAWTTDGIWERPGFMAPRVRLDALRFTHRPDFTDCVRIKGRGKPLKDLERNNISEEEGTEREIFEKRVLKMDGFQGRKEKKTGSKWPEERRRIHSEKMKEYWRKKKEQQRTKH